MQNENKQGRQKSKKKKKSNQFKIQTMPDASSYAVRQMLHATLSKAAH